MAIKHVHSAALDLNDGLKRRPGITLLGLADAGADQFEIDVKQGGAAATLTGATVQGYFVRADGQTVYLTGSVSGTSKAVVELTPECYAVLGPGSLSVTIIVSSSNICTLLLIDCHVVRTQTGDVADYGDQYPTLQALQAALNGKVDEPPAEGTNGQVLATDGEGGRYWLSPAGVTAVSQLIVDGDTYTLREGSSGAAGYITIQAE